MINISRNINNTSQLTSDSTTLPLSHVLALDTQSDENITVSFEQIPLHDIHSILINLVPFEKAELYCTSLV